MKKLLRRVPPALEFSLVRLEALAEGLLHSSLLVCMCIWTYIHLHYQYGAALFVVALVGAPCLFVWGWDRIVDHHIKQNRDEGDNL